jgi:hypothetical protein
MATTGQDDPQQPTSVRLPNIVGGSPTADTPGGPYHPAPATASGPASGGLFTPPQGVAQPPNRGRNARRVVGWNNNAPFVLPNLPPPNVATYTETTKAGPGGQAVGVPLPVEGYQELVSPLSQLPPLRGA